jgi:hypothetical protein
MRSDRRLLADLLVTFGVIARIVATAPDSPTVRALRRVLVDAGLDEETRTATRERLGTIRRALARVGQRRRDDRQDQVGTGG